MPDQTLFRISCANTINNHVGAFVLLISGDYLILTIFAVCSKQGKELEQVHHLVMGDHILYAGLDCCQASIGLIISGMPRTPLCSRHAYGTVAVAFTFRSEVKYVRYKHLRNTLLIFIDILSAIQPSNSCTHGCFQFTNDKRKAVYKENDIQTFAAFLLRVHPLVCHYIRVKVRLAIDFSSEEVNHNLATIFAKRIRVLFKNSLLKQLILRNQIVRISRKEQASQLI